MLMSIVLCAPFTVSAAEVDNESVSATSCDFSYSVISKEEKTCEIAKYNGSASELSIPSQIDGYTVTSIGSYAFEYCTSLKSITIPNSVTTIEQEAFNNCSNLSNVRFGKNVQQIGGGAFWGCDSLVSIILPESVSYIGGNAFGYCTSLSEITIPQKLKSIEERTFEYCSALTTIIIPSTITSIGSEAFWGCINLISISIPSSVTKIGGKAFAGCNNLCNVTISNGVQSLGTDAFASCPKLKSITLPNSLTSTGPTTFEGSGLTYVEIQDGIKKIGTGSFTYCSNLQSVAIPNSVTEIGREAFLGCDSLKQINIPDSVSTIGRQAFHGCDSLESVRLPNGITTIQEFTLADCRKLKTIFIPKSVKYIGMYAFRACYDLQNVYYSGSKEEWLQIGWNEDSGKGNFTNANIHYNSKMPPIFINKQIQFKNEVYLMNVNDTKEIKAYICDVYNDNGKIVYENKEPIDSSKLNWSTNIGEENKVISFDQTGKVTALSEGWAYLSAYVKDDINMYASCQIYVGKPNALEYNAVYDTKQYYAENGFYSQTSSMSDCVEIYCLFENKLADELQTLSDKLSLDDLSAVSPITLTATVSGSNLSFSRNSYKNTYTATFDSISAGKAVDDILMLFPYNLSVSPSGNTYTVTVTLQSNSFDTITEKYTVTIENLENKSANEHIGFAASNPDYLKSKNNTYGQSMVTLKNDAEYKWSKYSSLDFENYYEVVFADVLAGLMDTAQLGHISLLPVVKEWVGNYKTILSSVSTMVEDDYTGYLDVSENAIDKVLKKSKYTTDGMNVDDELRDLVVMKLKDKVSIDKINSAFAAVDKTKQYYSFFKLSINITNDIADFIDSVSVLNAYKEMDDEFKAVVNNLYNQIPTQEKKLKDAVYHYVNVDSFLGYSEELFNEVRNMAGDITLDVFKSIYKKQVISSLCKVIGKITLKSGALLSSTPAFSAISTGLGAVSTGATLGVCISDILCNNSGKSAEMSKIIAMSEFSPYIINTLNHYESKLNNNRNNIAVAEFEYAFAMHKATQSYIMEHTVKALEIKRDSLIIKLFGRDDYDGLISDILAQKQSIENLKCHTDGDKETVVTKTKVIAVKCPVNVFVYDKNGNEVVRIVNNVKEYVLEGINILVDGDKKYIALPATQNYSTKIVATDKGTMDYLVTEYDKGAQRLRTVNKTDIPLVTDKTFTGEITEEMTPQPEKYALTNDDELILPNTIIDNPITGVQLNNISLDLIVGDQAKLTANVVPENVTNAKVRWVSDNPSIANVDDNGNITALSTGKTTIYVITEDWGYVDSCTVSVYDIGDVNGDGKISILDATEIQKYIAQLSSLKDEQLAVADVNGDGKISIIDATEIQKYIAQLIPSLG